MRLIVVHDVRSAAYVIVPDGADQRPLPMVFAAPEQAQEIADWLSTEGPLAYRKDPPRGEKAPPALKQ